MPFRPPRPLTQQDAYYRQLRDYGATRRVAPVSAGATDATATAPADPVARLKDLAELRESGALTDAEFATAKAKVLDSETAST
jgi:Short C-terminal domain